MPSANLIGFKCTLKISARPFKSGRSIEICLSNLPGRSKAESKISGRLVAAKIITPKSVAKPSISVSNWFKVFSRSSLPPCTKFLPRALPTASISSMKIIQGAFSLACLNKSRTRLAPTPTNISTKSEPDKEKKGTPASPATAFANKVLPVPGGPTNKAPLGILPPSVVYFLGFLRKSTISITSTLASSKPATSLKVVFTCASLSNNCARLLPILNICPPPAPPPPMRRITNIQRPINNTNGNNQLIISPT